LRLHDPLLHHRLFFNPSLAFGEAYMDGRLTIEGGDIYDALEVFARNLEALGKSGINGWMGVVYRMIRLVRQFNPIGRARVNVAHHYDLTEALYDLFLDSDKQYSCGYFRRPETGLEEAQQAKKRIIAEKLLLEPGMKVLDIGCGWGGLAFHLAREKGVHVTGLTLSTRQLNAARRRAAAQGLENRVQFHLRDYREETGGFDRIVSVGMFEHVGISHYRRYFSQVRDLLTPTGGPASPTPGSTSTSSPAATSRRSARSCRRSRNPGFGPPTSRCCGCITPTPSAIGAGGSPSTGTGPGRFTTNASAGCGNTTWLSAK
jgi:cyclopropane-fatty-acyl-phospholipid synthase